MDVSPSNIELSEFEKQRARRIAHNKAKLRELGIETSKHLLNACNLSQGSKPRPKRKDLSQEVLVEKRVNPIRKARPQPHSLRLPAPLSSDDLNKSGSKESSESSSFKMSESEQGIRLVDHSLLWYAEFEKKEKNFYEDDKFPFIPKTRNEVIEELSSLTIEEFKQKSNIVMMNVTRIVDKMNVPGAAAFWRTALTKVAGGGAPAPAVAVATPGLPSRPVLGASELRTPGGGNLDSTKPPPRVLGQRRSCIIRHNAFDFWELVMGVGTVSSGSQLQIDPDLTKDWGPTFKARMANEKRDTLKGCLQEWLREQEKNHPLAYKKAQEKHFAQGGVEHLVATIYRTARNRAYSKRGISKKMKWTPVNVVAGATAVAPILPVQTGAHAEEQLLPEAADGGNAGGDGMAPVVLPHAGSQAELLQREGAAGANAGGLAIQEEQEASSNLRNVDDLENAAPNHGTPNFPRSRGVNEPSMRFINACATSQRSPRAAARGRGRGRGGAHI